MSLPDPPVLLITERATARGGLLRVVAGALDGGCRWVMVREKDLDHAALSSLVAEIRTLARPYGATVTVNDDTDIACDGVHLPAGRDIAAARRATGTRLLGASAHSLDELRAAHAAGADYATLSPIFLTNSKPGYGPALGPAAIAEAVRAVPIPIIALAGIDATNAADCRRAGASGIAAMGGVMRAADPENHMRALIAAWHEEQEGGA